MNTDVELPSDGGHPSVLELVDFFDGDLPQPRRDDVESHVRGCAACSATFDNISSDIGSIDADLPEPFAMPDAFVDLISGHSTGSQSDDAAEITPGDLWLLAWEATTMLGVVIAGADAPHQWQVAPATVGGRDDIDGQVIVEADNSPFGVELRVWTALATALDQGVFLRRYAPLPQILDHVSGASDRLPKSWDAALLLAEVGTSLHELTEAQWIPARTSSTAQIAELMRARQLKPSQVAEATGITPDVVMNIAKGVAQASPAQAAKLAELFDVNPTELSSAPELADALVDAVSQPRWRARIRLRAALDGVTEAVARLTVATEVMALPARTTHGDRDATTWNSLIEQYLYDE